MKVGDLVRNKNLVPENQEVGIILRWHTFDPETNPYTCPIVKWIGGTTGSIQESILEVVSAGR